MDRLGALYAAFNARDIDTRGRAAGSSGTRRCARRTTDLADGRVAVEVAQVVRSLDGAVLSEAAVRHVYTLRDGLVARMDVEA
jgi:hypothetical protein